MKEIINLIPAIEALKEERRKKVEEFEKQMAVMDAAISAVGKANQACTFCNGKGWRLRSRVCAEDDRPDPDDPRDRVTCKACRGTGWKHWTDEKGVIRSAQNNSEF